jgi:hypothetical protein
MIYMRNRRQFLQAFARGTIFASLALLSGSLIRRRSADKNCQQNYSCGNCNLSNRCRLAEADHYRLEKARISKKQT